jgi:hypothetical protein
VAQPVVVAAGHLAAVVASSLVVPHIADTRISTRA